MNYKTWIFSINKKNSLDKLEAEKRNTQVIIKTFLMKQHKNKSHVKQHYDLV